MLRIAVVRQDESSLAGYLEKRSIPVRYMEEFSVQGITVSDDDKAFSIVASRGYRLTRGSSGFEVEFSTRNELPELLLLLQEARLNPCLRDIAETYYQA
jgi:hypothetical protein